MQRYRMTSYLNSLRAVDKDASAKNTRTLVFSKDGSGN